MVLFPVGNNIFTQSKHDDVDYKDIRLSDVTIDGYFVPGVTAPVPISRVIKIGHLNDIGTDIGDQSEEGAILAAREINEADGIDINGTNYYVGIVSEDTNETASTVDLGVAENAVNRILNDHDADFVIGGSRPEAVNFYRDFIMDNQTVFLNTGCNNNNLTESVLNNYFFYKYYFRSYPVNSSSMGIFIIYNLLSLALALNSTYVGNISEVGILRENSQWNDVIADNLISNFSASEFSVYEFTVNPSATPIELQTIMDSLNSFECDVVIPLISESQLAIDIINAYSTLQPNYILAGIDVFSSLSDFWDETEGGCEYEILIQNFHCANLTTRTIPFWNNFIEEYGHEPISYGASSYDAVYLLVEAINSTKSFNSDNIISYLETVTPSNPFIGVTGQIAFDSNHGARFGYPFLTPLMCQWQTDGTKVVVPSYCNSYNNLIVPTGSLKIPPWVLSAWGVEPGLPGNFFLNTTADFPDPDGAFNLTWTPSYGADNYSIYHSSEPITYIHDGLDLLADKNGTSPHSISGLGGGMHYYLVVAYNESGQTFSNLMPVEVALPPGSFVLSSDAGYPEDRDGKFNLSWTPSLGADNYSIYINSSYQGNTETSPFLVSNLTNGYYVIEVVAINKYGNTTNMMFVNVSRYLPPTSTSPSDVQDTIGEATWISWRLSSNYGGGEYRIIANNSLGQYYIHQDWQPWISDDPINILVNSSTPGIYNYTIAYRDTIGQYGITDTVIVTLSSYFYPLNVSDNPIVIDLEIQIGIRLEIYVNADASFQIVEQDAIFTGITSIDEEFRYARFYSFTVFDSELVENNSLIENMTIRFYYDGEVRNPSDLIVYHYNDTSNIWEAVNFSINETQGYIEITVSDLSYFSVIELTDSSVLPFDFMLIIIVLLSVVSVLLILSIFIVKRKHKTTSFNKVIDSTSIFRTGGTLGNLAEKGLAPKKGAKKAPRTIELQANDKATSEEQAQTEKEIDLKEDLDKCIVHKGVIRGISYVCPTCHAKYCLKCLKVLSEKNEKCWVCNTDNFKDDESFKTLLSLPDDTNKE